MVAPDDATLGMTARDLDAAAFNRYQLPSGTRGVLITRVEPVGAAADGGMTRGTVVTEINRRPVLTVAEFTRATREARVADVLTFKIFVPGLLQHQLKTVRVEER